MSDLFDNELEPMSLSSQQRAEKASPNGRRCLVENRLADGAVQWVNVVDRKFTFHELLIECLEWSWGLRHGSLNLDTHKNVFSVGASLRELYQEDKWMLIPEESDIDRFLTTRGNVLPRYMFPKLEGMVFRYTFFPIQEMDDIYITRQSSDNPLDITVHDYPFNTIPTLTSHIHPAFAIARVGELMDGPMPVRARKELFERFPTMMRKLWSLYLSWKAPIPDFAYDDPTFLPSVGYHARSDEESGATPSVVSEDLALQSNGDPDVAIHVDATPGQDSECPGTPQRRLLPLNPLWRQRFQECREWDLSSLDCDMEDYDPFSEPIRYSAGWSAESIADWVQMCSIDLLD
ncbi:hypothetical protein CVT24_012836 [Panaeolus cyanescens]|uniref:HNH nuclease domain-containing protein n=1 Tax=Panaeolus cyanescens TaxID=181874 RepID=A0A409W707_9AGAR|nr:hypothetical protein CVT24_012836 [Panaeolus cyanescens]